MQWTAEEQRRLEQLLVKFPSEDVEMERWKKIANALGNRTAVQVQSRTQKYFLKLQKAGLPVPGKIYSRGGRETRSSRNSMASQKRSTFFPQFATEVKMDENDDEDEDVFQTEVSKRPRILNDGYVYEEEDVSDEEGVSEAMKNTDAYQELMWLKRVRREKELEARSGDKIVHVGFRCDGCDVEPIVGGRFQCVDCLKNDTVDFCLECAPKGLKIGDKHDKSHKLKPVRRKRDFLSSTVDAEYRETAKMGYLNPNFTK